jgi:hypothetical protein
MTRIHEKLTCRHYSEIRRLITASRSSWVISENEQRLFELAEPHMRVAIVNDTINASVGVECIHFGNTPEKSMSLQDQMKYREYFAIENGEVTQTTTKNVPRFTFEIGAENSQIITNIEKDALGMWTVIVNNDGIKFVCLTNPYQATIHELWHNIDCLACGVETIDNQNIRIPLSSLLFHSLLRDCFKFDFHHINDSRFDFYNNINELKNSYQPCNLYYLFDIVEGISHCYYHNNDRMRMFNSEYAPRPDYWIGNGSHNDPIRLAANILNARSSGENITAGQIKLATEFFAAVGCITSVGDEVALSLVRQYLSNSYDAYNIIVESAIRRMT